MEVNEPIGDAKSIPGAFLQAREGFPDCEESL